MFGEHNMDLLCRQGFYPYAWVDGIEKLDFEGIPPPEAFHSQLINESVLYADYNGEYDNDKVNKVNRRGNHHQREPQALP